MAKKRSKYVAKMRASKKQAPADDPKAIKLKEIAEQADATPDVESEIVEDSKATASVKKETPKKVTPKKSAQRKKKKFDIAKKFREVISELKKVDWPPFQSKQQRSGVLQSTSTVLVMVLIFAVVVVAFDSGLLALLNLLTGGTGA